MRDTVSTDGKRMRTSTLSRVHWGFQCILGVRRPVSSSSSSRSFSFSTRAEQLAGLADLTGVPEGLAPLDQGEHFLRRLDMEPDAVMERKRFRDVLILELQGLPPGRR